LSQTQLDHIRIVLVNTTHPGNIGAAARAMKNMGLSKLYIVEPKTFPSEEANWRAGHALDVLESAKVTENLESAIEGCGLVIGTSARERKIPWPLLNPRACANTVAEEVDQTEVAIVFGREDRGLTNEELQMCNLHLNIPTNAEYSSLNLAQAVQVVCYELRMRLVGDGLDQPITEIEQTQAVPDAMRDWDVKLADAPMLNHMFEHLEQTLIEIEFLDPEAQRQVMTRFRRLFTRVRMDEMEVQMMRGMLKRVNQLSTKLRDSEG